mgnify:CR=1 FL=1|jgi:hypothetical protein
MKPVMRVTANGYIEWRFNGYRHRTEGPAIEGPAIEGSNGYRAWFLYGKRHRTDGPAVEQPNGTKMWWIDGIALSFDEWLDRTTGLTDEEKVMLKLQYG